MAKGKPLINSERCKGCALCIRVCPKKILEMSKETNGQGVHYPVAKCVIGHTQSRNV